MSITQQEKAARFRALHDRPGVFVIPNPWDVASARILAGFGFEVLALLPNPCTVSFSSLLQASCKFQSCIYLE